MRVVLDTNILISACWTPGGNEARVIAMAIGGDLEVAVSVGLEAEYRDVAQRKKFTKQRKGLEETITALLGVAVRVTPTAACDACSDADDNQLLDCALAAGAQFVVTGNGKHFPQEWRGVRVINARALLDLLLEFQRIDDGLDGPGGVAFESIVDKDIGGSPFDE